MRRPLSCLVAALLGSAALAPVAPGAAPTFHRTDTPMPAVVSSVAVANVDGVHGPDIVLGLGTSQVGVALGHGDGTFAPVAAHAGCANGGDVHTTDLNLDGHVDIVEACSGSLGRFFGDGAGGFGAPQTFSSGSDATIGPGFVVPAELTGGGAPELVFASTPSYPDYHRSLCFAYANDGVVAPNCGNPPPFSQPSFTVGFSLAAADLNNEGTVRRDEIIAPSANDVTKFTVFGRNPNPGVNYNAWSDSDRDAGGANIRSLAVGDADGDGTPDVIIGHGTSTLGTISVQRNGPGGIGPGQQAITIPTILDPHAVGVGDFDRDGHPDLVAANGYGQLAIHHGNGNGTFGPAQVVPLYGNGNPAYASYVVMKVADFNGDGAPDVAVGDGYTHLLEVLLNTTPAPLKPQPKPKPKPVVSPLKGLAGLATAVTASGTSAFAIGTAANPPTASTAQTLVYTPAKAAVRKRARPVAVARGTTRIPKGRRRKITVRLTKAGRVLVGAHARLKVRRTIVATGASGRHATTTRTITLRRPKARPKR